MRYAIRMTLNIKNESFQHFIEVKQNKTLGVRATKDEIYTDEEEYKDLTEFFSEQYPDDFKRPIIRPFYPGGDYEDLTQYPDGCLVFDNPPFSISAKIIKFYLTHNIKFLLFAPGNSLYNMRHNISVWNGCTIHYDATAFFTQFVTNLDEEPTLHISGSLGDFMRDRFNSRHPMKKTVRNRIPDGMYYCANIQQLARAGENKTINMRKDNYKFYTRLGDTRVFGGFIAPADSKDCTR